MGPRQPLKPSKLLQSAATGGLKRRQLLRAGAAAVAAIPAAWGLAGCRREGFGAVDARAAQAAPARWVGAAAADHARGHRLRGKSGSLPAPARLRRAAVVVVGAGVAGLAAARALAQAGVGDVQVLELADQPGGHSRGHVLAGMACPLGAHYLPVPGPAAREVSDFLFEVGLLRHELGRTVADERHLCHSPQERLYIDGHWSEGLLPPADAGSATMAQYRAFAAQVRKALALGFALPSTRARWTAEHAVLDGMLYADWLDRQGLTDARLRWYLDYCCRDDYGAGLQQVSAWAGLHYFASRHGFQAPGESPDSAASAEAGVFTWPQGNAWLVQRLAAPCINAQQLHGGRTVLQVEQGRAGVQVLAWNEAANHLESWQAQRVVLAVPLFVAARLLAQPPSALLQAAAALQYAPWLVANLHLDRPLVDRPGAPPSWDNVRYADAPAASSPGPGLGWVDAIHQSLRSTPGPTVLTVYRSLLPSQRAALLAGSAQHWATAALSEISAVHPDLPLRLQQVDLMRWGHAMAIPAPGVRSSVQAGALAALRQASGRVHFAHSDLGGSSVFEEAFTLGHLAGQAARA